MGMLMKAYKIQQAAAPPMYFRYLLVAAYAVGLERKYQAIRRKLLKADICEVDGVTFERIEIQ